VDGIKSEPTSELKATFRTCLANNGHSSRANRTTRKKLKTFSDNSTAEHRQRTQHSIHMHINKNC